MSYVSIGLDLAALAIVVWCARAAAKKGFLRTVLQMVAYVVILAVAAAVSKAAAPILYDLSLIHIWQAASQPEEASEPEAVSGLEESSGPEAASGPEETGEPEGADGPEETGAASEGGSSGQG